MKIHGQLHQCRFVCLAEGSREGQSGRDPKSCAQSSGRSKLIRRPSPSFDLALQLDSSRCSSNWVQSWSGQANAKARWRWLLFSLDEGTECRPYGRLEESDSVRFFRKN